MLAAACVQSVRSEVCTSLMNERCIKYLKHQEKQRGYWKSNTHGIADGQKVDYVVVELCHMIAHVKLCVFVSGARVFLSHMHPQD